MKKPKGPQPISISTAELSEASGWSSQWLHQLARESVLPRPSRGRWPVVSTLKAVIAYRDQQAGGDGVTITDLRKRKIQKETERIEFELLKSKGEFKSVRDIAVELRALCEKTKATIQFKLIDQIPQLNSGLGVVEQRVNCKRIFREVLDEWQKFGKDYEPPGENPAQ